MSSKHPSPRQLLVISSWAPPMIGGPQSFANLMKLQPEDSLSILTSAVMIDEESGTKGQWLHAKYYYYDLNRPWTPPAPPAPGADTAAPQAIAWSTKLVMVLKKIPLFGSIITSILIFCYITVAFTKRAIKITQENGIQTLMGLSDNGPALVATWLTSLLTRRPYVIFMYDLYRGNNLSPFNALIARLFEGKIMRGARLLIVTNDATADHYQRRYGINLPTAVIYNSVFPENYTAQQQLYKPTAPYKIIFTGHVYWAQEQAVLNLIQAMDKVQDLPVKLDLYIPKANEIITAAVAGKNNIRITAAPQSEMPRVQSEATLLFLPLAWNTKAPDIIATATPGKFTDYLASGRPMLVHAPDYAYVSQYTKQHELGIVVDTNSVEQLAMAIRNYLKNPSAGQRYVDNALRVFHENHDARKNAQKLTELLNMV